jgi:hypothetical protein
MVTILSKKKIISLLVAIAFLFLFWLLAFGDAEPWRYSKNLSCSSKLEDNKIFIEYSSKTDIAGTITSHPITSLEKARMLEICRTLEKHLEYKFFGHAIVSFGYRATFNTARKTWCELTPMQSDANVLKNMEMNGIDGAWMLWNLLDSQTSSDPTQYGILNMRGSDSILKDGCID